MTGHYEQEPNGRVRELEARAERVEAALYGEIEFLREQILQAEADIKALGIEAHPAVLMRMDRLVRVSRRGYQR